MIFGPFQFSVSGLAVLPVATILHKFWVLNEITLSPQTLNPKQCPQCDARAEVLSPQHCTRISNPRP